MVYTTIIIAKISLFNYARSVILKWSEYRTYFSLPVSVTYHID